MPADIEQTRLEADPDGEPAEDERRGLEDRVKIADSEPNAPWSRAAYGLERQGPVDRAGRDEARKQDDHAGDDEGEEDGRRRAPPLLQRPDRGVRAARRVRLGGRWRPSRTALARVRPRAAGRHEQAHLFLARASDLEASPRARPGT